MEKAPTKTSLLRLRSENEPAGRCSRLAGLFLYLFSFLALRMLVAFIAPTEELGVAVSFAVLEISLSTKGAPAV